MTDHSSTATPDYVDHPLYDELQTYRCVGRSFTQRLHKAGIETVEQLDARKTEVLGWRYVGDRISDAVYGVLTAFHRRNQPPAPPAPPEPIVAAILDHANAVRSLADAIRELAISGTAVTSSRSTSVGR